MAQEQLEEARLVRDSEIASSPFANRHFPRAEEKHRVADPTAQGSVLLAEQSSKCHPPSLQTHTMEISDPGSSVTC